MIYLISNKNSLNKNEQKIFDALRYNVCGSVNHMMIRDMFKNEFVWNVWHSVWNSVWETI